MWTGKMTILKHCNVRQYSDSVTSRSTIKQLYKDIPSKKLWINKNVTLKNVQIIYGKVSKRKYKNRKYIADWRPNM